jgi:hypothetical protein
MSQETLDTKTPIAILQPTSSRAKKELTKMIRKFSNVAIWVVLGLAVALAPLACSSDSTSNDAGNPAQDSSTKS